MIGFIDTLSTVLGTTCNYSSISDLHTSQFTVTHALRFSVFTSRILATDASVSLLLQITYEVFLAQSNSFLTIILQLPIPKTQLNSISLLPSSYPGRLASRNSTLHFSAIILYCRILLYNHVARTTQKTQLLLLRRRVY
jgi:hypothetical protein